MKILLLGASGLLGHALFEVFKKAHHLETPSHAECNVEDAESFAKILEKITPDLIVNATGFTKVDIAESEKEKAYRLNAQAVENIVYSASSRNIPVLHFSTDYVFDGTKQEGYAESDPPAPLSVYGISKAAGEKIVKNLAHYYLIRTSWLYGPGGTNFVDTILRTHHDAPDQPLRVVNDQIGCPTYTRDLAQAILTLLEGCTYGIYHIVNEGACSWYEYAVEVFRQLGLPQRIEAISSEELHRLAQRPHYSILNNTKLPKLRHWKEALGDYLMHKTLIL